MTIFREKIVLGKDALQPFYTYIMPNTPYVIKKNIFSFLYGFKEAKLFLIGLVSKFVCETLIQSENNTNSERVQVDSMGGSGGGVDPLDLLRDHCSGRITTCCEGSTTSVASRTLLSSLMLGRRFCALNRIFRTI